ncbi:hypothetical protein AB0F43_04225 [Kribbella sp. NPDC023972]|uniref:hypothetical protein n=1 Tax=Kribbella sp. NPDC023972 TaxID=3154795 RepID=UPI0033CC097E
MDVEADVADRTRQIAQSLSTVRASVEGVAYAARADGELDRVLADRLRDVDVLREGADLVRKAEGKARTLDRAASEALLRPQTGYERADDLSSRSRRADDEVRQAFGQAQKAATILVARIDEAKKDLGSLAENLKLSSERINSGLEQLDAIEQLPEQRTSETEQLRVRLKHLQVAVATAGAGVTRATTRVESARVAAAKLQDAPQLSVDGRGEHSAAVNTAISQLETHLSVAREGLAGLGGQAQITAYPAHEATIQGEKLARQSAELADAARAGLNPPPADPRGGSSMGEQDRRHGTGGPSQGKGITR